jgi:hypothetical protein
MKKLQLKPLQARPGTISRPKVSSNLIPGHEKRRGVRLNSRVPIAVEWDAGGQMHRGEAKTRVIGPYGCMAVLPQELQLDQRISVINLVSSQASPGVIVWRGHQGAEGWELGIELINPEMGFWGIDL